MNCENCGCEITKPLIDPEIVFCDKCYEETNGGCCGIIPCMDCPHIDCEHAYDYIDNEGVTNE